MIRTSFQGDVNSVPFLLQGKTEKVFAALARRLTYLALELQRKIVTEKLSGQVLHHRSGKLAGSIVAYPAVQSDTEISARVEGAGGAAWYGRLHEFGGTFDVPEHARRLASKADLRKLVRDSSKYGGDFVTHGIVRAHKITFPQRSFMASALAEMRSEIVDGLQQAVGQGIRS